MSTRTIPLTAVLAAGVGLGSAGEYLLRAPGEPGLNFTLLFAGLAASVVAMSLSGGPRLSREAGLWLAAGALFGFGILWRGSELLRFLAFVAAALAFALPALHGGGRWVRSARVGDVVEAVIASGLHAVFGSVRLFHGDRREHASGKTGRSAVRTVLIGGLLAIVPLAVFGALFMSADRVFAGMVSDFVRVDLQSLASHVVLAAVLSWLACGYLAGFASGTQLELLREVGWKRPSLRVGEAALALGLVDLLFLAFVTVQFRYLFGGGAMVEVTPGLTYAAYAREGFFQLVAATALGLPWLLAVDTLLGERDGPARWTFRSLAGAQLVLLLGIVASAVQRLRAYLEVYGLTESRIVAMAVLAWSALLVVWFGATVLRGRRGSFVFGALVSGYALVMVLQVVDPAGRAARSQLARAEAGAPATGLDVRYLARLGSDATPLLVARLDDLGDTGRCLVARSVLRRWGPDRPDDWRNWNRADDRAREAVRAHAARLEALAGDRESPCEPAETPSTVATPS